MKIIGHRGAAGLAPENSASAIKHAMELGVYAIEIDVHVSADSKLLVLHDANTKRVTGVSAKVRLTTAADIISQTYPDGTHPLTLEDALAIRGNTPLIIETKDLGTAEILAPLIKNNINIFIASFIDTELKDLKKIYPEAKIYLLERHNPARLMQRARFLQCYGVGLNFWLINPITYVLARFYKLEIYVFTVNSPVLAKAINFLYPRVMICTNYPNKISGHESH